MAANVLKFKNEGSYVHAAFDDLMLDECSSCRTSWVNNPPTPDQLQSYYGDPGNYTPGAMKAVDEDRWPIWNSRAASLITFGRMFTDFGTSERFCDIGPGNGAALSLAPLLLPEPQLGCIEYSERTIAYLKRHDPRIEISQSVDEITRVWGQNSIGMLYSAHCFEHFGPDELNESMPEFFSAIRPGGVLVVEVPFAPPQRVAKTGKHTPHLIFFTPSGLRAMLQRHGFEIGMCVVAPGTTPNTARWFRRTYKKPDPEVVGRITARRVETLNSKDFISRSEDELTEAGKSGVIKCVAIKP